MDLFVTEILGYGDLQMNGNDVAQAYGLESLPFLSLFGGSGAWWGNALMKDDSTKFISLTEKALSEVALNSAGRITIEQAIKSDLAYIKKISPDTTIDIQTSIISDDRLEIRIRINGKDWVFNWSTSDMPKFD